MGILAKPRANLATIVPLGTLILSAVYVVELFRMSGGANPLAFGPTVYPMILAISFLLVSIIALLRSARPPQARTGDLLEVVSEEEVSGQPDANAELPSETTENKFAWLLGITVGYIVIAPIIGHLLSSVIFATAITRIMGKKSWLWSGVIGIVLGIAVHVMFYTYFGIPLPTGLLSI